MKHFAALLDRLSYEPQRTAKLKLLSDYFAGAPDPDRGWALAALTGDLDFRHAKPVVIRDLVTARMDPVLFTISYDYVGDLAETVALVWPDGERASPPRLQTLVERLQSARRQELPPLLAAWLDSMSATERWALLKLVTGALRVGVSARLARTALAAMSGKPVADIEEVWHAVEAPYADLFAWLDHRADAPLLTGRATFRPVMLAHPIDEQGLFALEPGDFQAEWKWDGIRVQLVGEGRGLRLYARSGDEITAAFPDALAGLEGFAGVLDGELLVRSAATVAPFADLQKRLNRKTVAPPLMRKSPAFIRAYDLLFDGLLDIRGLPLHQRRQRLELRVASLPESQIDLSPLVPFSSWADLAVLRLSNRADGVEGLMLKRRDSTYVAGRPTGPWWKWKRDPMLVDAVLMYAQRGHGKRSSYYSDFTFGVWRGQEIVPVGKAYFGFTDAELVELDRWVRNHTMTRFGPVREVRQELVLEVAFEGLQRSGRHKSGIAMRFPRINRIRWDKPAAEADRIEVLEGLLSAGRAVPLQTAALHSAE
jgi:DNA ligase-1